MNCGELNGVLQFAGVERELHSCSVLTRNHRMLKPIDVVALLSSAAMMSRKAVNYPPDTHVIDLDELRQIAFQMEEEGVQEAG
jgi:hypothetical protein